MSIKYAQQYKIEPKEEYFSAWRQDLGGNQARTTASAVVADMKKQFLNIVAALDMDVKHLIGEEDYWWAYLQWDKCLGKEGYPIFLEKIKSYEDENNRDAESRTACEKDDFEAWLQCHQKLHIQALVEQKHISRLKLKDELELEFRDWRTCPWKGDVYDHAVYLLKYPKGPSGRSNLPWAEATMKCFYEGIDITKDEDEMIRLGAHLPLDLLKPKHDMIQDLMDAKESPEERRERLREELKKVEEIIAKKKKEMSGLKKQYTNLVANIKRKKTFLNLDWDFKDLPKTKRARIFRKTVTDTLNDVKELEKIANAAREDAKLTFGIAVEELFK